MLYWGDKNMYCMVRHTHVVLVGHTHIVLAGHTHVVLVGQTQCICMCFIINNNMSMMIQRIMLSIQHIFFYKQMRGSSCSDNTCIFSHTKKKEIEDICTSIFIFNSS